MALPPRHRVHLKATLVAFHETFGEGPLGKGDHDLLGLRAALEKLLTRLGVVDLDGLARTRRQITQIADLESSIPMRSGLRYPRGSGGRAATSGRSSRR